MSGQAYKQLLEKYLNGTATEVELRLLEQYADEMIARSDTEVFLSDMDKALIKNELRKKIKIKSRRRLPTWTRVAASIVLIAALSYSFWLLNNQSSEPEMAVVSTQAGEQKTVTLEDGTVVELNALSSIEYPETFAKDSRKIALKGEALFKVSKDANRPFTVLAQTVSTKVLGTQFNIKAYADDAKISVALLEGSVEVNGLNKTQVLVPGQQANFKISENKYERSAFDINSLLAWQRGEIILSNTSFAELKRIIARTYGVEIQFDQPEMAAYTVSGKFKNPTLTTLLKTVCAAKSLQFKEIKTGAFIIY